MRPPLPGPQRGQGDQAERHLKGLPGGILPFDQFALDGRIPDWEGFRAHMNASTPEKADEVLAIAYGAGRHTSTYLQE